MRKLLKSIKTLLIAAGLLVGTSAWAVDVPTPVYFNDFNAGNGTTAPTGLTIHGNGTFVDEGDTHFGMVFQNGGGAQRTHYLQLPEDVLSHSATTKKMTIGFWVNAKNAGESNSYLWAPLFMAYAAAPSNDGNTSPMLACQYRGTLQVSNAGWCDYVDAQNAAGTNTLYHGDKDWLADDEWHYYTVVFEGENAYVYFDGVLKNQWNATKDYNDGTQDITDTTQDGLFTKGSDLKYICLGGNQAWNWGDNDAAFRFDDFAVYDAALSAEQIEKIIDMKLGYTTVTYDFKTYGDKTLSYEGSRCANANSSNFYLPTNLPEACGRLAFAHNDAVSVSSSNGLYLQRSKGDYAAILGLANNDKITINLISGDVLWRSGSTAISVSDWTNYENGKPLTTTAAGNLYFQGKNTCKISSIVIKTQTVETMTTPAITSEANGTARTVTITAGVSNIKSGVTTYYTTDGSDPTSASTVYSAPFDVTETTTVKAISISNSSAETASTVTTLLIDMDQVDTPTATLTAVNDINRTITFACATEGATLYYSTDNGESYTEGTSLVISENTAIIVKATKGSAEAVSDVYNFEAGTAITLNTPTWTKTGYSEGVSTVTLTDNQSNKLLSPISTIKYQINDGEAQTYSTAISVNDGETLKYWSEATGYTNSAEGSVYAAAPCSLPNLWNETYSRASNGNISVNTEEVVTTIGGSSTPYYYMYCDGVHVSDNLVTSSTGLSNWMLRSGGIYGGNTGNYAVQGVEKGDYVTITYSKGDGDPTSGDGTLDEWNSTSGSRVYKVTATMGNFRFSFARYGYIKGITVQRVPVSATITSAGWATLYTDQALDFSSVDGLKAYTATLSENTVTLNKVDNVPAGTGVVLKATETLNENKTYSIPVAIRSTTPQGDMKGSTTEAKEASANSPIYILKLNDKGEAQFMCATSGSLAAGKAYLEIANGGQEAKALTVVFANDPTGIANVNAAETVQPVKRIVNGQLVIEKNGKRYNAAGAEF